MQVEEVMIEARPDIVADDGVIHVIGGLLTAQPSDQTGTEQQQ